MLIFLGLAALIWALGRVLGVGAQARWLMLALLYLAVTAAHAILPVASARILGGTFASWAVIGGFGLVIWAYGRLLGRLRQRAQAVGPEAGLTRAASGGVAPTAPPRPLLPELALPGVVLPQSTPHQSATTQPHSATFQPAAGPASRPTGPTEAQIERYSRHIMLREIGGPGQQRLAAAHVVVVGAGGIGAPALLYLAAAGVGRITVIDDDRVSLSNLQRQVIHSTAAIGTPKVTSAAAAMSALNPEIRVEAVNARLDPHLAARLFPGVDLVLDGTDSYASRALINRAAVGAGVPLLSAAVTQWEGQVSLFDPARGAPCLSCIFPTEPAAGLAPDCAIAGVAGPLPGVMGTIMALEAVKEITQTGAGLRNQLLIFDGLYGETRRIAIRRDPDCPVCGGAVTSAVP